MSRASGGVVYLQALSGTPTYDTDTAITDAASNKWSFSSTQPSVGNSAILVNGSPATLWHMNSQQNWWSYNGSGWTGQAGGPAIPSPAGLPITPGAVKSLTERNGNAWSFGAAVGPNDAHIVINGGQAPCGAAGNEIVLDPAGTVWQSNSLGNWYTFTGSCWNGHGTTGPATPAWTPGAMVVAGKGMLPPLNLVAAGAWPITSSNANLAPVVANGKVYVASYGQLTIWGKSP